MVGGGWRKGLRGTVSYPIRDPAGMFVLLGIALILVAAVGVACGRGQLAETFATYAGCALFVGVAGRFVQFMRVTGIKEVRRYGWRFAGPTIALVALVGFGAYYAYFLRAEYAVEVEPVDRDGVASLRVAMWITGAIPKEGLFLMLMDPRGEAVYRVYVSPDHLRDGFEEVHMKFGGVGSRFITPRPGGYNLVVNRSIRGGVIHNWSFYFARAKPLVTRCSLSMEQLGEGEYELTRLNLTVHNGGGLPSYVYSVKLSIDGHSLAIKLEPPEAGIVLPVETKTISQGLSLRLGEGEHEVSLVLLDRDGAILAEHSTNSRTPP